MTRIAADQLAEDLAGVLARVSEGRERLVLQRAGEDFIALIPVGDLELLEELEDRLDLEDGRAGLAEAREKGTRPWESVKAQLGL